MPPPKVPPLGNSEYQVGWITALPLEMTAARAMLDEIHEQPQEQDPRDYNSYCLGRIQKHNIVIACLPDYGTNSAAIVAEQMLHTFKEIRFGLMVGIGGGVPSPQNDIRLGDVVVSRPEGAFGGVIQYDLGKTVKDGHLHRTGSLDRPPQILLSALRTLESNHDMEDTRIPVFLKEMVIKYPQMQEKFMFPSLKKDRLFKEDYDHTEKTKSCDYCDLSQLIDRKPRESDVPTIHYGLIASGNQIMRHGPTRSRLGKELGVLCFEMEAAGLMNHFKCLAVRGICDYSDSHKNKEWQHYAATTAAAYAKELLLVTPAHKVQMEKPIAQVADLELQRIATKTLAATSGHYQKVDVRYRNDRDRKCHQLFKTSEYESGKNRNPDRVEGTCQWVLNHVHYQSWLKSTHDDLLWISADPGCGKSVLSKSLIDREFKCLEPSSICYYFFKDDETQSTLSNAICALLHQLFSYQPHLLDHGIPSCDKNGDKLQKETTELWRILLSSATDTAAGNVVCILDALDECVNDGQLTLIKFLSDFYNSSVKKSSRSSTLKFLITSRPYYDIERGFQRVTSEVPHIRIAGDELNEQISAEIDHVARFWVSQLSTEMNLQPRLRERLQSRLEQTKNRTYLWLYLVFEELRNSPRRTEKKFTSIIDEIPKSVDEAYENILDKSKDRTEARILLSLIVSAKRPLELEEIDVALGLLDQNNVSSYGDLQLERHNLKTVIRDLCGLFVYVADSRVHLLHQTAKEFLMKKDLGSREGSDAWKHSLDEQECEVIMAKTCVQYLLLRDFEKKADAEDDRYEEEASGEDGRYKESIYDFMDYSATYWPEHFREADFDEGTAEFDFSLTLFEFDTPPYGTWFPIWRNNFCPFILRGFSWRPSYFAAFCGHRRMVKHFLKDKTISSDSNHELEAALLLALEKKHSSVAKFLVENGADVNFDGFIFGESQKPPLHIACSKGDDESVRFLVEKGADVNMKIDPSGYDALAEAARSRQEAIMRFLIKEGANDYNKRMIINRADDYNGPLWEAAFSGHETMVRLLIANGADDCNGALWEAARSKNEAIVRLLIANGADDYNSALREAACFRNEAIVRLLIANGADDYNSAFWGAAWFGHKAIIRLLIANGADDYNGALRGAAQSGHEAIVRFLIANGADDYNRALWEAVSSENEAIVRLLIANGADDYSCALWEAAWSGNEAMARLLIVNGFKLQKHRESWERERLEYVRQILVMKGADVNLLRSDYIDLFPEDVRGAHETAVEFSQEVPSGL